MLWLDFETRSPTDLPGEGSYNYAYDPDTCVLIACWAIDDGPVHVWIPEQFRQGFQSESDDLFAMALEDDVLIAAHNASFERLICTHVLPRQLDIDWRLFPPERFVDTAAVARENGLPGKLGDAARCAQALAGRDMPQKDHRGDALMRKFSTYNFSDCPWDPQEHHEDFQAFIDYCKSDVAAMRAMCAMLPEWQSQDDWCVAERINERGIGVDRRFARHAALRARDEPDVASVRTEELTDGEIATPRSPKMVYWVYERLPEGLRAEMRTRHTKSGLSLDAETRQRLLARSQELLPECAEALDCVEQASASAASKYSAIASRASVDVRMRGAFVFWGAHTGRATSHGLQMQNLPRDVVKTEEFGELVNLMQLQQFEERILLERGHGTVLDTLGKMLRYSFIAPRGHKLVGADWSQIEGRLTPWLSFTEPSSIPAQHARAKLDVYADPQRDVYCETAGTILGRPIGRKDSERQGYGKVPELSLGFGGGVNALMQMAKNYKVSFEASQAKTVVDRWRTANPWAPAFWQLTADAAITALRAPGRQYMAGRCGYLYEPDALAGAGVLRCILPFGGRINYPAPRVSDGMYGEVVSYTRGGWKPKKDEKHWPRAHMWGGVLVENAVQATAAGMLRQALRVCDKVNAPVVMHVHDEIVLESSDENAEAWRDWLTTLLESLATDGLPLAAEGWIGPTFAHGKA